MGKNIIGACLVGAAWALCGCTALVSVPTEGVSLDTLRPHEPTYVVPDTGKPYQGQFFRVESDSLILKRPDGGRVGTRLGHIRKVSVWRLSPSRTAKYALGIAAGATVIWLLFQAGVLTSVNEDEGPVKDPTQ